MSCTSSGLISSKMRVTSAVFISGSKSSSRMSYGSSCVLEALDVALAQLDVALEQRQEDVEVRRRLRLEPDGRRLRGRLRHLAAQLGRHLHGLRVVAARDADDRRVPGVGIERVEARLELVEQPADLRVGELLVREPLEQRDVSRALHEAGGRHHRALVPGEQVREGVERRVVGESRLQLLEGVGHRAEPSSPPRCGRAGSSQPTTRSASVMNTITISESVITTAVISNGSARPSAPIVKRRDAAHREHPVGRHRGADDRADLERERADERDQRVAERVPHDDAALAQPLGARDDGVRLAERDEHRRADVAAVHADEPSASAIAGSVMCWNQSTKPPVGAPIRNTGWPGCWIVCGP